MKPIPAAGEPVARSATWSAPLDQIPPGCSAKFHILLRGKLVAGFVVNFAGRYHAYLNHCAHAGTPLDWWPNEFFSDDGRFLVCGTHGSRYHPDSGKCAGGPCAGRALISLRVRLTAGRVVVTADAEE